MSNNTIMIVGRAGQAPKLKTTPNGKTVANFSMAVKEFATDGNDTTLWLDVELWNGLADRACKIITKGRELAITGRLMLNTYERTDNDGVTHRITKPVVRVVNFHLCGRRPDQDEGAGDNGHTASSAAAPLSEAG